ncbi:MAG: FAD binding domain-containing protein [Acidimicrobiales bacterium]
MYPAGFEYLVPASLSEALQMLASTEDAKVIAGGQSLIPMMKLRFARPSTLIDLAHIKGLDQLTETDDELQVGAMMTHAALAGSEVLQARYPVMASAAPQIADPIVRNRGTIGGSIAHADPAGDWSSVMMALSASVVAQSVRGSRVIAIDDLLVGAYTTSLEPDEILTQIRIPRSAGQAGGTYVKLERKVGDFATVAVAVQLELASEGDPSAPSATSTIAGAGIALTAVASASVRATAAEDFLAGQAPGPDAWNTAADLAADAADPTSDVRGSADYKRDVVRVFVRRGLARAHQLASAA